MLLPGYGRHLSNGHSAIELMEFWCDVVRVRVSLSGRRLCVAAMESWALRSMLKLLGAERSGRVNGTNQASQWLDLRSD